jgi:hypothetical protein
MIFTIDGSVKHITRNGAGSGSGASAGSGCCCWSGISKEIVGSEILPILSSVDESLFTKYNAIFPPKM